MPQKVGRRSGWSAIPGSCSPSRPGRPSAPSLSVMAAAESAEVAARPRHGHAQVRRGSEEVSAQSMSVRTDDGRNISFDLKDYNKIDHGYAATIHKAQGMTVDRAHVLATPGMDAHGSYVALSRHRDGVDLHYGRDDFASQDRLTRTLSRDRSKDMASDYERADPAPDYAQRRGITFRERVAEIVRRGGPRNDPH